MLLQLEVDDIPGTIIITLLMKRNMLEKYSVDFNKGNLSSGTYGYNLPAGNKDKLKIRYNEIT